MARLAISSLLEKDKEMILDGVIQKLSSIRKNTGIFMNPETKRHEIKDFLSNLQILLEDEEQMGEIDEEQLSVHLIPFCRKKAAEGYYLRHLIVDILQIKEVIWVKLQEELKDNPDQLMESLSVLSNLFDEAIKYMGQVYMEIREEIIESQKHALRELSVPVVPIFDDILILPLVGTVDTNRAKQVMENLLEAIVNYEAEFILIDITGVPIVDTVVAHHLIKTVQAARLLGTQCILVGIRPEIANTIVELGVDLGDIRTQGNLKSGIDLALSLKGLKLVESDEVKVM